MNNLLRVVMASVQVRAMRARAAQLLEQAAAIVATAERNLRSSLQTVPQGGSQVQVIPGPVGVQALLQLLGAQELIDEAISNYADLGGTQEAFRVRRAIFDLAHHLTEDPAARTAGFRRPSWNELLDGLFLGRDWLNTTAAQIRAFLARP